MGGEGADRIVPPEPAIARRVTGNTLYLLQRCDRRLWLSTHAPDDAAPAGDFDELLREKGRRHEAAVRSMFSPVEGPIYRGGDLGPAAAETLRLLAESRAVLYQPALLSADDTRAGVPDFLYWDDGALVLHDAKTAIHIDRHPEIALQLTHYAVLLEEAGRPPARLEVTNGALDSVEVEPVPREAYEERLAVARTLLAGGPEPGTLLAHSTCRECPFYDHCWDRAVSERRVEILSDVWTSVAPRLHARGIRTFDDLAAREPAEIREKGLGKMADSMVAEARAHRDGRPVWIAPPDLPAARPVVWFDLEGDPDAGEGDASIYLWGLAVDPGGEEAPPPEAIVAPFTSGGDREGWERFVTRASGILERWPDAPWVHYASYEKTWVREYIRRHGAPAGFAEGMERALFDLYTGLKRWVRLPLRSYSIKQVAPYAGFAWSDEESGSAWSIVQVQRARALAATDPAESRRLLDAIARYNADDLMAMRAVWRWIERERPAS